MKVGGTAYFRFVGRTPLEQKGRVSGKPRGGPRHLASCAGTNLETPPLGQSRSGVPKPRLWQGLTYMRLVKEIEFIFLWSMVSPKAFC